MIDLTFRQDGADVIVESRSGGIGLSRGERIGRPVEIRPRRSLDDLIRPRQQRRWDGEAEGLRCLHVDDQFELHRLFDG